MIIGTLTQYYPNYPNDKYFWYSGFNDWRWWQQIEQVEQLVQKITLSYIVLRLECVCANASYCQLISDAVTWVQVSEAVQSQALNVETHLELDRNRLDECLCEQPAVLLSCHSTSTNMRCHISSFIHLSNLTHPAEDCFLLHFTAGLPKLKAVSYPDLRPWI